MDDVTKAEGILARIRATVDKLRADEARLAASGKYTPQFQQQERQKLRAAAKATVDGELSNASSTLRELAKIAAEYSGDAQLERGRFVVRAPLDSATEAERSLVATLRAQEELLTELVLTQRFQRTSTERVDAAFHGALSAGTFAVARLARQELQFRAAVDDSAKGAALRTEVVVSRMPPPPEVADRIGRVAQLPELIQDAARAIDSGDDPGRRSERIAELQRAGATNAEINSALASMNATG
jgi:hypothetical protein